MAKENRLGMMEVFMKAPFSLVKNMALVNKLGQTEKCIKGNGLMIKDMDKVQ